MVSSDRAEIPGVPVPAPACPASLPPSGSPPGSPPRVSVVIPTLNRSRQLAEAIRSVRAVEGPDLDLEIIVVDNGSTDDTEQVARDLGARFLRCTTRGSAAARNVGIRAATGEYLALLDDDDIWLPAHVRPHLALLDARPDFVACIGQIVLTDPSDNPIGAPFPQHLPDDGDVFEAFLGQWPQIGAVLLRTSVRESVGYLDESIKSADEWDWLLRIALKHRIGSVPVPVMHFRLRPIANPKEDAANLERVGINRSIFWRNVWRARGRRLSPLRVARAALRYDGVYASYFLRSGAEYAGAGQRGAALRSFVRAARISPLHAAWAVAHDPETQLWLSSALTDLGPFASGMSL